MLWMLNGMVPPFRSAFQRMVVVFCMEKCHLLNQQTGASSTLIATALTCPDINVINTSMKNEFGLDLKVQRRKSGLTQGDAAHLLSVHPSKVSLLESGKVMPSFKDICALTLVYGRSFETLFLNMWTKTARELRHRLSAMPDAPKRWLGGFNRRTTLTEIADRVDAITQKDHE
jgi:transcriptional regulator with XRE-family HTH domain